MKRALIAVTLLAALTACGSRTRLYPEPGMTQVPKAATSDRSQTAEEMMRPSTQAQPDRQADLIGRSTPRGDDPFDLPPGRQKADPGTAPKTAVPMPENVAPDDNVSGEGRQEEPTRADPNAPDNSAQPGNGAQ